MLAEAPILALMLAFAVTVATSTAGAQPAGDAPEADGGAPSPTPPPPDRDRPSPGLDPVPAEREPPPPPPPTSARTPWRTSPAYPEPGTPPEGLPPPPRADDERYWRHAVELIPELGVVWPRCREGDVSSRNCEGVTLGGQVGFTALWRVFPYFAWGGTLEVAGFQYEPPQRYERENASAASVSLILLARAYFLQEGTVDPYVQLGLGGGALGTAFDETVDGQQERFEETGAGPAIQVGAGVDFYLSRRLRLGPAVTFTQVSVDKVRRCTGSGGGECVDLRKDEGGYLDAYAAAGVRLTVCLGEEL